jgi:hypothetical protein
LALNQQGANAYRKMQKDSFLGFSMWLCGGALGGYLLAQTIPMLPLNPNTTPRVRTKYKLYSIGLMTGGFAYHGYKRAKIEFFHGRKLILGTQFGKFLTLK